MRFLARGQRALRQRPVIPRPQVIIEQLQQPNIPELFVVLAHHHRSDVWLRAVVVRPLRALCIWDLPTKETPLVFELSLCLSRACLGRVMYYIYK